MWLEPATSWQQLSHLPIVLKALVMKMKMLYHMIQYEEVVSFKYLGIKAVPSNISLLLICKGLLDYTNI